MRLSDIDFGHLFKRIEHWVFGGHYANAFGSLAVMQQAREYLLAKAVAAGLRLD